MKRTLLVCFAILVIITSIYATDAGYRIIWAREVQTPDAQRALKVYIEDHCRADFWEYELPAKGQHGQLRLHCEEK